jgi:hypothetical protein
MTEQRIGNKGVRRIHEGFSRTKAMLLNQFPNQMFTIDLESDDILALVSIPYSSFFRQKFRLAWRVSRIFRRNCSSSTEQQNFKENLGVVRTHPSAQM